MTREEAIKLFRRDIECLSHDKCSDCILEEACDPMKTPSDSEYIAAYGMAIEALSTSEIPNKCEDAISRQAVMDAFNLSEKTRKYGGDHSGYDTMMLYEIQDVIEDLPSVTPKQKMGRWIRKNKHNKDDFQEFDYWDVRCSECGARKRIGWTNVRHCPNCGAKMEESEDT